MSKTEQPKWKLAANLGDAHPIDYGGYFIFVDETGVYPPEAEYLIAPEADDQDWTVYRFILESCTWDGHILSDNKFHPEHPAWFADKLQGIADCAGMSRNDLIDAFTQGNACLRAEAWRAVGEYYGFDNLDSYPLTFKDRSEVEARYSKEIYSISR